MPASLLWAVDVYGRVFSLSTAGQQWEQCHDIQMEFKRVTAARQCCWGIACDNNIYLNVHASDLPVRYQEETYENQVSSSHLSDCQRQQLDLYSLYFCKEGKLAVVFRFGQSHQEILVQHFYFHHRKL